MTKDLAQDGAQALVDSAALNGELVELCMRFEAALFDWMDRAIAGQPVERCVPVKLAVSEVAFALTDRLLYPTFLQFPQLLPPDLDVPAPRRTH